MSLDRHLYLVGMMGAGKTRAGRILALRLKVPFADTDLWIEDQSNMSVAQYFEQKGEAAFRVAETQALHALSVQYSQAVISTGGGIVLKSENRSLLRSQGYVVYLRCTPEQLLPRIQADGLSQRPLLQTQEPLKRLKELYGQRDPLYAQVANRSVDVSSTQPEQVAAELAAQLHFDSTPR